MTMTQWGFRRLWTHMLPPAEVSPMGGFVQVSQTAPLADGRFVLSEWAPLPGQDTPQGGDVDHPATPRIILRLFEVSRSGAQQVAVATVMPLPVDYRMAHRISVSGSTIFVTAFGSRTGPTRAFRQFVQAFRVVGDEIQAVSAPLKISDLRIPTSDPAARWGLPAGSWPVNVGGFSDHRPAHHMSSFQAVSPTKAVILGGVESTTGQRFFLRREINLVSGALVAPVSTLVGGWAAPTPYGATNNEGTTSQHVFARAVTGGSSGYSVAYYFMREGEQAGAMRRLLFAVHTPSGEFFVREFARWAGQSSTSLAVRDTPTRDSWVSSHFTFPSDLSSFPIGSGWSGLVEAKPGVFAFAEYLTSIFPFPHEANSSIGRGNGVGAVFSVEFSSSGMTVKGPAIGDYNEWDRAWVNYQPTTYGNLRSVDGGLLRIDYQFNNFRLSCFDVDPPRVRWLRASNYGAGGGGMGSWFTPFSVGDIIQLTERLILVRGDNFGTNDPVLSLVEAYPLFEPLPQVEEAGAVEVGAPSNVNGRSASDGVSFRRVL